MNSDGHTESAPAALYRAHAAQLLLYGRALGLSHAEAEDVLHEVFLGLLGLAESPLRPENYLVRSVRNRALNYKRSFFRRLAREFESTRWFESSADETPAERAAMRCLERLPTEQREVIVLKVWHELTFEEIGELLDLSPNTAAGRYRYGLQKLRACLSQDGARNSYEFDQSLGETVDFLDSASALRGA
ncbi:MAG TPA: sigma-70 family RNA polymerase sigma factor [Verrucomicrobiota bacterium]|nr:sigma-70 family RNA polymerase sigma factor [Verrucomicrobiota bacterium]